MQRRIAVLAAVTALSATLVTAAPALTTPGMSTDTLRKEAPIDLRSGSASSGARDLTPWDPKNPTQYQQILSTQFNSVTPENDMKWDATELQPNVYDFSGADAVVAFAEANNTAVRGHTLLRHNQNPQWVMDSYKSWTCDQAKAVLKDHITTVVGHFKGKIYQWDGANEIFHDIWDPQGVTLRTDQNPFLYACPSDPVGLLEDAFRWAHTADPNAVLFLNDYAVEGINAKTDAYYYGRMLQACLNVPQCTSFTVWQYTDSKSWVAGVFPGKGHATPYTADYTPKLAYFTLRNLLAEATPGRSPRVPMGS